MKLSDILQETVYSLSGGMQKVGGEPIHVMANTVYYLGASSSPDQVYVKSADDKFVTLAKYPYKNFYKMETPIFKNLAYKGTKRYLEMYGSVLSNEPTVKSMKKLVTGKPGTKFPLDDFLPYEVIVVATDYGKDPKNLRNIRNNDLWYAAEQYGGVGGLKHKGEDAWIISTYGAELKKLKKDKLFKIVKTTKR